jgi:ABC-type multidrug transport system fused ATPase/permease subunit
MSFFDQTPLGRIINRLSNDISRIDGNIPWAGSYAMSVFSMALNSLISICVVIPILVIVVVPLLAFFLGIIVCLIIFNHYYLIFILAFLQCCFSSFSSSNKQS